MLKTDASASANGVKPVVKLRKPRSLKREALSDKSLKTEYNRLRGRSFSSSASPRLESERSSLRYCAGLENMMAFGRRTYSSTTMKSLVSHLESLVSRLESLVSRLESLVSRLESLVSRLESFWSHW